MIYVLWYPLWLPIIFDNIFILGRTLSQYPPQWIFALISFVCIWVLFARQQESIFAGDTVLFLEEEVRMLCFVSSSKAIRQIRQGALSARLQEGFSLRMEQLNNCYYLQWAKRRSILRTIRKGKVGHQAGKKAFKQHHTQRMWMSFQCKQLTIALLQITIPGVLAMCQALDIHYYL